MPSDLNSALDQLIAILIGFFGCWRTLIFKRKPNQLNSKQEKPNQSQTTIKSVNFNCLLYIEKSNMVF